jgi:hypothetical protein
MAQQIALDLFKNKNGDGRHGRPHERKLAADLKNWLGELNAAETLRRRQLREIAELRQEIYRHASERGVTPAVLRATRKLMLK